MTAAAQTGAPPETIEVSAENLPLYCPGPQAPLWSMHPRVYLDVVSTGVARCAYCGAQYRLKPDSSNAPPEH
jgi:uncharacterized Zn-finger protein